MTFDLVILALGSQEVDLMSGEQSSKEPSKPRLCDRCGSRVPPQKRGRPRRWCSQQCRQLAYEERPGLESWKDKQPKVNNPSDVAEVMSESGARRYVTGIPMYDRHRPDHKWLTCMDVVCSDEFYMRVVLDAITDELVEDRITDTIEGRFLASGIARLVDTVAPGVLKRPDPS